VMGRSAVTGGCSAQQVPELGSGQAAQADPVDRTTVRERSDQGQTGPVRTRARVSGSYGGAPVPTLRACPRCVLPDLLLPCGELLDPQARALLASAPPEVPSRFPPPLWSPCSGPVLYH
jgi:hypothetical protein